VRQSPSFKGEDVVLTRAVFTCLVSFAVTACANEVPNALQIGPTGSVVGSDTSDNTIGAQLPRKTMSDKVLTAIALERVTGLKPDPARLLP